jgi:hypothetical protein
MQARIGYPLITYHQKTYFSSIATFDMVSPSDIFMEDRMAKRFWLFSTLLLMGCSTVSSSYHYTMGTEAVECGDLDTALEHLEQAVALDPSMGRNHNNLCAVYMGLGRMEDAWHSICQAVWALSDEEHFNNSKRNFMTMWNWMREHHPIQKGLTVDEVVSRLGTPNSVNHFTNKEGCVLTYGFLMLSFEGNSLNRAVLLPDGIDQL